MARHLFTVRVDARDLNLVVAALTKAALDAEGEALFSQQELNAMSDVTEYDVCRNARLQREHHAMRKALDTLYGIVYSAQDEEGNYPHLPPITLEEAAI